MWLAAHDAVVGHDRATAPLDRFGTVAASVIAVIEVDPDYAPLRTVPEYSTGELRHLARGEQAVHLDDMLLRRTSLAFLGQADADTAREIADAVAPVLGWDAATVDAEVARALSRVRAADPAII